MTDRELLELAAKAAGIEFGEWYERGGLSTYTTWRGQEWWNPLTNDGDALRLAVKLRLDICRPHALHKAVCVWVDRDGDFIEEPEGSDPYAATRRAIVRAAAAMGQGM